MSSGIDTATNVSSVATCLKNAGVVFVGRYYAVSSASAWKVLTVPEAQAVSAAGLYIVSIWEENPTQVSYFTYPQGRTDGRNAFNLAAGQFGQPPDTPVYFAVDYDAVPADRPSIVDYFYGVRQGYTDLVLAQCQAGRSVGPYYTGVYGSCDVLTWCRGLGLATYFWQAYAPAWSAGRNAADWPGYQLRQRGADQTMCGISIDPDVSSGAGGGWKY